MHMPLATLALSWACSTSAGTDDARDPVRENEVLAAAETPPSSSSAIAPEAAALAFVGSYRHSGGQAEQNALESAVDDVVQDMNVLAREIARKRLLAANRIPTSLEISTSAERMTIQFDDRSYTATLGGPAVDVVGITGDPLRMTLRMRDAKLLQHFVGDKGKRTNTIRRNAEKVAIHVVVESDSLPKKLVYELTFSPKG
jgi:hypothetical protein